MDKARQAQENYLQNLSSQPAILSIYQKTTSIMIKRNIYVLVFMIFCGLMSCAESTEDDISHINTTLQDYAKKVESERPDILRQFLRKVKMEGSEEGRRAY